MHPRAFGIIAVFLLLSGASFASFELRSLNITITLNSDGTAHAVEQARLFITGNSSINLYEQSKVFNDLSSWTSRTGISDIRTHVSRLYVELEDLQVRPASVDRCNNLAQTCYATLTIDYNIYPITENSSGILQANQYKPRTTKYSLRSEAFTFERSKTDDIILPKETAIKLILPQNSRQITFAKVPDNLDTDSPLFVFAPDTGNTYYLGQAREFIWSSQSPFKFALSYETELSLEEEIVGFFSQLQAAIFLRLLSAEGLAYILAACTILLSIVWLHSLEPK